MTGTYTTPRMQSLWSDATTMLLWSQIEAVVLKAQSLTGLIPEEWAHTARDTAPPSTFDWELAKLDTGHEVVAFLHAWGLEHVHIGITSSDLTDTALAIRIRLGNEALDTSVDALLEQMIAMADEHNDTMYLARTHGQPAVPDSFGRRLAAMAATINRCSQFESLPGKMSGPVGSYLTPAVDATMEDAILHVFELTCDCGDPEHQPISTQIVPRDYLSRWAWAYADLVSACAAVALNIRLMAHSGVREVREGRDKGYVGSSAMPHKSNPNQSERLTGLGRIARASAFALSEGIEQWHERDLAHSSVERVHVPLLMGVADYAVNLLHDVMKNLQIDKAMMTKNLNEFSWDVGSHQRQTELQLQGMSYTEAAIAAGTEQEIE